MTSFIIEQKRVDVFASAKPDSPAVYLNTCGHEGEAVFQHLRENGCPDFSLIAAGNLEWNRDMVPWDIPPISDKDTPCTGGADDYLKLLLNRILPEAERALPGVPSWRGIAGYSLAGLFAVYALYQTDAFSRIASVSGSLWFPGIKNYIFSHAPKRKPDCMYFSLGDRECRTRNPFLRCVQKNTQEIQDFYNRQKIDTVFQLNPGNHFKDGVLRTAAGLEWILRRENNEAN